MKTPVTLTYEFHLSSGRASKFTIQFARPGFDLIKPPPASPPSWCRLESHQCTNCPLSPGEHPYCPIALSLVDVIESFKDCLSTEEAEIVIRGENREYRRRTAVQHGISALMGVHMVTSGCPVMDKLRPLVPTHLPFATLKETLFRAVSMYLLAQYFRDRRGLQPDWRLEELAGLYEQVRTVNRAFVKRLLSINPKDASLNALVSLDCFATATAFALIEDSLKDMESLFRSYFDGTQDS